MLSPITVFGTVLPFAVVVTVGVAAGVGIDLDHFFIARGKTGRWDAVRFCLSHPTAVATDQDRIFGHGDVGILSRLLSHLLIVGVGVPVLALSSRSLAILIGVVLYVHIVCDVVWDIWRLDYHAAESASIDELVRALR